MSGCKGVVVAVLTGMLLGCQAGRSPQPQAVSLLGEKLYPMELAPDARAEREANLRDAEAAYEADPRDEDAIIWLGRRQAYLGLYDQAIETFTAGLAVHPRSFKLRRHRGHRYITVRQLDRAIDDLERAAELARGVPDEVEPDGMPNRLNQPTSTNQTNIHYHLGLARYLTGDFDGALAAYTRCLEFAKNNDMTVATLYWITLTLHRLGEAERAAGLLEPVTADMPVIENTAYHRLLLLFKGDLEPRDLRGPDDDAIQSATEAYGLACWHRFHGEEAESRRLLEELLASPAWPAFGYIAAEADMARGL